MIAREIANKLSVSNGLCEAFISMSDEFELELMRANSRSKIA